MTLSTMSTIKHRHLIHKYLPIHWQEGDRALYIASSTGQVEVVKLLLDRGADIEATDNVSSITMESNTSWSWESLTLLLQLHDVEYYVDYYTTTHLLLHLSISANTLTGRLQSLESCLSRGKNWSSETASRQRRRHWSFFWFKLHRHVIILLIVHNWIGHCVNTNLQWSRHIVAVVVAQSPLRIPAGSRSGVRDCRLCFREFHKY